MNVAKLHQQFLHAAQNQQFTSEPYGQIANHPLTAFHGGNTNNNLCVYISAGIHGDEPAGVLALLQLLRSGFFDQRAHWLLCPMLNPTGLQAGTRENFQGRDLNRDYHELYTTEICAHRAWLTKQTPHQLNLSLHEDWETTGFYLYEINTSPLPCIGRKILQQTSRIIPVEPNPVLDGHDVTSPGYIFHVPEPDEPLHWPEAIFHIKQHPCLSCTFETPSRLPEAQRIATHILAVQTAVELFLHHWQARH